MKLSDGISLDDERDIITAFGTQMTGDLLRAFAEPSAPGVWFHIVRRADGVMTVETYRDGEVMGQPLQ